LLPLLIFHPPPPFKRVSILIAAKSSGQGDRMSLRKNCPKCSPTHFCSKFKHYTYLGKAPKIWATYINTYIHTYFCNF
jgi:hypothetical protein